jgi:hypothetical protein
VAACFAFPVASCEAACDLLSGCGAFPPGDPECVDGCRQSQQENPEATQQQIDCIVLHLGEGRCDLDGVQRCIEGAVPPPDRPDEPPPPR